ncbi:MAG: class I SAM-dependent methyltransferase, partial [Chloroflexota bacterium]|nr:class I SAM-dependent methyltransferase [Chloroflexota bacterium]
MNTQNAMMYHDYAPFYDGSGQLRFAVLMGQYLGELLDHHPVAGRRALDVACGTGTLALLLADQGWDVTGLDSSAAMLDQADAKAENMATQGQVVFIQGDMRALPTNDESPMTKDQRSQIDSPSSFALRPSSFDLVTCVYDSLNYVLEERELAACFEGVARVLAPGGLLVADMNTRSFLEHDWGTCEVIEQAGLVQVSQSYFDPAAECSTMILSCFAGDDQRGYTRFDETHVERAYAPEIVARLLGSAGLELEALYDCFTFQPIIERTQRFAWVARKPELRTEDCGLGAALL